MKKLLTVFLLAGLCLGIFATQLLHTQHVFKNRLKEYDFIKNQSVRTYEKFRFIAQTMDEDGVIYSELHDEINKIFLDVYEMQKYLKKNWDDYINFDKNIIPGDIKRLSQKEENLLKLKIQGLGLISRLLQFDITDKIDSMVEKNDTLNAKFKELSQLSDSSVEELMKEYMQINSRSLDDIQKENMSMSSRSFLLEKTEEFLKKCEKIETLEAINGEDEDLIFIITELKNNELLEKLADIGFVEKWAKKIGGFFSSGWESVVHGFGNFKISMSRFFGNTVGSLQKNRKPFINTEEILPILNEILKPGDVLVEKAGFLMTDTFIPGHFGHVAIYSGKPGELFQSLLKDDKNFIDEKLNKLANKERKNYTSYYNNEVLEALRPGVTIRSLRDFLHIDDLAVLRLKENALRVGKVDEDYIRKVLVKAFSYLGTDYDFGFDVNTSTNIVCSEMPYQTMPGITFRTAKTMGVYNISPDDVAVMAGSEEYRPFELVYFSHQGKEVPIERSLDKYIELLEKEGSDYYGYGSSRRSVQDYSEYNY